MQKNKKIAPALLISTYNWPEALAAVLNSVAVQSLLPAEVLIADDGSDGRTKAVIDAFRERVVFPVRHAWQEDRGFRLAAARNRAIALCGVPYIIQTDGDIILHRHFVKDHVSVARRGYFVAGNRGDLSQQATERILRNGVPDATPADVDWSRNREQRKKVTRIPWLAPLFYGHKAHSFGYGIGANLAFWTDDLLAVNGYDESFEGWGSEDNDIMCRLMNAGVRKRTLRMKGVGYHLFHAQRNDEGIWEKNKAHLDRNAAERVTVCKNGIVKKG